MLRTLSAVVLLSAGVALAINVAPSKTIPGGLAKAATPQFIVLGADDNTSAAGLQWMADFINGKKNPGTAGTLTGDGEQIAMSFYVIGNALNDADIVTQLARVQGMGCEVSNHTQNHVYCIDVDSGIRLSTSQVTTEIDSCNKMLASTLGITAPKGMRIPYLAWSDTSFTVEQSLGFTYDCSINEGQEWWDANGISTCGAYVWPYTLDNGSPSNDLANDYWSKTANAKIGNHPGLWELPCYMLQGPTSDAECTQFGCPAGFVARTDTATITRDPVTGEFPFSNGGKLTGLDYNVFGSAKTTKEDALALLKSNLDKMYNGNRTPMTFGLHTQYYADDYDQNSAFPKMQVPADRRWVIENFITWALANYPDVRFVSGEKVIDWCIDPVAKGTPSGVTTYELTTTAVNGSILKNPAAASYASGTTVSITATPNAGYHFVSWSGDASGTTNTTTVSMTSAKNVIAVFEADAGSTAPELLNLAWYSASVDTVTGAGSAVTAVDSVFADNNSVGANITVGKMPSDTQYTFGSFAIGFDSAMTGITKITIIYTASKPVWLSLEQDNLMDAGTSYGILLEAAGTPTPKIITIPTDIAQPSWVVVADKSPLDLSLVKTLSISPALPEDDLEAAAVSGSFTLSSMKIDGFAGNTDATPIAASTPKALRSGLSAAQRDNNLVLSIPTAGMHTVELIGLDGRKIATLANASFASGLHTVALGARASGVYLVRISGVSGLATSKVVLR